MTPRRGFLQALGVATLAVALDVLPTLGFERPSVAPPADEHYLEWHPYGSWLCSETITAVNRVGDRFIVATPTRCYSIIAEKSVCFNTPNQMFGMSRSTYYLLPRQPVSRPFVPLSGLEPRQSADPSRSATSR